MKKKLFMTVFMARSGSKFLRSLLNQHPSVHDFGEVFHNRKKSFTSDIDILNMFSDIMMSKSDRVGVQFRFPRHFKEFEEIVDIMEKHNDMIDIVFLMRRSKIKGAISQQNAEKIKRETGKAHLFQHNKGLKDRKLVLDVPRAINEMQLREKLDTQYLHWAQSKFNTHVIYYEDLCRDQFAETNKILDFLGLNRFKKGTLQKSDLVKITSDNLEDSISNYSDLMNALNKMSNIDSMKATTSLKHSVSKVMKGVVKKLNKRQPVSRRSTKEKNIISERIQGHNNTNIDLDICTFAVKTNTRFLEHVTNSEKDYIIATVDNSIITKNARELAWSVYNVGRDYDKCFTTLNGTHLLQEKNSGIIYRYDSNWNCLDIIECGEHGWHGTQSIAQNKNSKTIMWCEYPYASKQINVWRSVDDGKTFTSCYTQNGDDHDPKGGDIRHFHLIQPCTSYGSRWYLSSGDTENQSKLWVTEDDGITFNQVDISATDNLPEGFKQRLIGRLHRFTALAQTPDKLIYVTDDTFKGLGALACEIDKKNLSSITVYDGDCGQNEMRNLIKVNDKYCIAISESKLDRACANVVLVDIKNKTTQVIKRLKNEMGSKSNFTNGIGSIKAVDGDFYTLSDNLILRPSAKILKWTVRVVE